MRHHAIRGRISGLDLEVERVLSVRNAAGGGLPLLSAVFSVSDSPGSQKGLRIFLFLSFVSRTSFLVFPLFSRLLCVPRRAFLCPVRPFCFSRLSVLSCGCPVFSPLSFPLECRGAGSRVTARRGGTLLFYSVAVVPSLFGCARPRETLSASSLTPLSRPLPSGELLVQFEKVGSLCESVTS